MSIENFNETLNSKTQSKSIILSTIDIQEPFQHDEENHNSQDFSNFKNNFLEEFNNSKW